MAKKHVVRETAHYLFPSYEIKNGKGKLLYSIWGAVVVIGAVLTSIPFVWMVITAFMPTANIFQPAKQAILSVNFDPANFIRAWQITPFLQYFINSVIVTGAVVLGQIMISAMAAYSLSKLKPPFYTAVMILFLSTIMIPFETISVPLYLFMRDFSVPGLFKTNLINTYWALILPGLANAFNIFILKSFFDKLPNDFIEAARIDGYGETGIFFRIIVPVSKPILSVVAVLNFTTIWNSFFWPLIVTNEPEMYTLMLGIYKIIEEGQPWNIVMAAVTISMIPTVLLFVFFQKQIMQGVVFTSLQE